MKHETATDLVVKAFLVLGCALVALLAFENLALSNLWLANSDETLADRVLFAAMIEAELIELTLAILVIFSLAASLFSNWFGQRIQERLENAQEDAIRMVLEEAEMQIEANKKEAYHAASANYYHELAFNVYETCGSVVEDLFEKNQPLDKKFRVSADLTLAKSGVHRGLYYTDRGLECIARYDATTDDFFLHRRVPWQLKNSRIWFLGAELVVNQEARLREQYDEPLSFIDELLDFVHKGAEPLPSWHNVYESSAFFLFQLERFFPDEEFADRATHLLSRALSGKAPKSTLKPAPADWIVEVKAQYEKAGLL